MGPVFYVTGTWQERSHGVRGESARTHGHLAQVMYGVVKPVALLGAGVLRRWLDGRGAGPPRFSRSCWDAQPGEWLQSRDRLQNCCGILDAVGWRLDAENLRATTCSDAPVGRQCLRNDRRCWRMLSRSFHVRPYPSSGTSESMPHA